MLLLALSLTAACPPGTVEAAATRRNPASVAAVPGDHLEPLDRLSVVAPPLLEKALAAAPPTRTLQMLAFGGFGSEPEYGVYVEGTQAVAVRRRGALEAEGGVVAAIEGSDDFATAWAPLDAEILGALEQLWADALGQRRPQAAEPDDEAGLFTYRFSRWQVGVEKSGQVRAPREDSPAMASLVDVGDALVAYASSSGERREPLLGALRRTITRAKQRMKAPGCIPVPVVDADCRTGGKRKLPVINATSRERFGAVWPRMPIEGTKTVELVLLVDEGTESEQCLAVKARRGLEARGTEHGFGFGTGLSMHDVIWALQKSRGRGENPVLLIP